MINFLQPREQGKAEVIDNIDVRIPYRQDASAKEQRWQEVCNPMKGGWILPDPDEQIVLWTDASNEFLGYPLTSCDGEVLVDDRKLITEQAQIN